MSIASEISRLQTAKADLKTAIEGKGVTVPSSAKLDGYADLVDSIETGGGGGSSVPENDVNFIDYDGTIVASYSATDFANLTSLPNNPDHTSEGLVSQGWNWTLSDAKNSVASNGKLTIGQMYITDDGASRITIDVSDWERRWPITLTLMFTQSKSNGVAVDWGDGSTAERNAGTTNVQFSHTYAATGIYTISLLPDTGSTLTFSGDLSTNRIFYEDNRIKQINFGRNVSIGSYAFYNSRMLQSITMPNNITEIGSYGFQNCILLKSVTIPSGVLSLPNLCFSACSLQMVSFPNSVTYLGNSALSGNSKMRSIVIPYNLESSGTQVLNNSYNLKSVTISNGAKSLGNNFFYNCELLQSIKFPSSVNNLGSYMLNGCMSLKEVVFEGTTPPTLSSNSLGYTSYTFPIYVPDSAVSAYKSAYTNYASRIKGISERPQ